VFGPENLKLLALRVTQGAGLLMIGGLHSFGPGGYAETPLESLLPVEMHPAERQLGDEIDKSLHHMGELKMLPTDLGERRFVMRLGSDDNMQRWRSLPPLNGANRLHEKNSFIEIWAKTPDGIPLLFAAEGGKSRVAAFAGDTTYLWFHHGMHDEHQRFWRQMILWLSHQEEDADAPVWVTTEPRNFSPGQRVPVSFGARNAEGAPIPDAQFTVRVHTPSGDVIPQTPQIGDGKHSAEFVDTQVPGDYWIQVAATKDGNVIGTNAWTRFIVDARDLELDNPAADFGLLEEIAHTTGGYPVAAEEFGTFLEEKIEYGLTTSDLTNISRTRLWDDWRMLALFVCLVSIEWYARKRRGMV
jgi:hypothetical protein